MEISKSVSSQNLTFLATGPATVVDIFHSTHLPRFPEKEKKRILEITNDAVSPHASANPHHSIRGRGLCERHRPREGNKSRKYQEEFHLYAGEGTQSAAWVCDGILSIYLGTHPGRRLPGIGCSKL